MEVRGDSFVYSSFYIYTETSATILLTPFRTQNVPPPMSSYQLSLSSSPSAPTPIYASFSSLDDTLAILYESGKIESWALHTRLGPGRGKVMDPIQTWTGVVPEDNGYSYRQVIICGSQLVVLGSGKTRNDILTLLNVRKGKGETTSIEMPGRNGRLLASDYRSDRDTVVWQASNGALFEGQSFGFLFFICQRIDQLFVFHTSRYCY